MEVRRPFEGLVCWFAPEIDASVREAWAQQGGVASDDADGSDVRYFVGSDGAGGGPVAALLAHGTPVCRPEWVLQSAEAGRVVEPGPHLVTPAGEQQLLRDDEEAQVAEDKRRRRRQRKERKRRRRMQEEEEEDEDDDDDDDGGGGGSGSGDDELVRVRARKDDKDDDQASSHRGPPRQRRRTVKEVEEEEEEEEEEPEDNEAVVVDDDPDDYVFPFLREATRLHSGIQELEHAVSGCARLARDLKDGKLEQSAVEDVFWTDEDDDLLRENFGRGTAYELTLAATVVGKPLGSCYIRAAYLLLWQ